MTPQEVQQEQQMHRFSVERDEEGLVSRAPMEDGSGSGESPRSDLTGSQFELRMGGLLFASCSVRHLFLGGMFFFTIGGPLSALPWIIRCLFAQLLGLAMFSTSGKWDHFLKKARPPVLTLAIFADVSCSILFFWVTSLVADVLFREPSPSQPVNAYWQGLFWSFKLLGVNPKISTNYSGSASKPSTANPETSQHRTKP